MVETDTVKEEITRKDACRMEDPERWLKLSAPIAVKTVKFRSNLILADQFIVKIVLQIEEDLDIRLHCWVPQLPSLSICFEELESVESDIGIWT